MPEIDPQIDTYELYGRTIAMPNGIIIEKVDTPSSGDDGTLKLALSAIRMQKLPQTTTPE